MASRWPGPLLTNLGLLRLYVVADKYAIRTGQDFALEQMGKRSLPAIFQLQCGLVCDKPDWTRSAFYELMLHPLHYILQEDIFSVTPDLFAFVTISHSLVDNERRSVVVNIPSLVHNAACPPHYHTACTSAWRLAWSSGFSRRYIYPGAYMPSATAKQEFTTVQVPGMTHACLMDVKTQIITENIFDHETRIIERQLDNLKYVGKERDRWTFPASQLYLPPPPAQDDDQ